MIRELQLQKKEKTMSFLRAGSIYTSAGWTGTMPNGDVIKPGVTLLIFVPNI